MPFSSELADKSVHAAVAAIEIYNKPNFLYREEAFALLMSNAWELLLKAKWLSDHQEAVESLYVLASDGRGGSTYKTNRSGNPLSFSAAFLAARFLTDPNSGLERACHDNILALLEIRDNAAHFLNKDLYFGRRVLEIGTASLRNYLCLATEWFGLDLSTYNFFLMPISFYHGFEMAEPATRAHYPDQVQRLLAYLDGLEREPVAEGARQHLSLHLETKLVRGKDAASVAFRWTDDLKAPAISVREEDVLKNYPMTYRTLTANLKRRYEGFLVNEEFHRIRQALEKDTKFALLRQLHPGNPRSPRTLLYSPNILQEFDKHYKRRTKPPQSEAPES